MVWQGETKATERNRESSTALPNSFQKEINIRLQADALIDSQALTCQIINVYRRSLTYLCPWDTVLQCAQFNSAIGICLHSAPRLTEKSDQWIHAHAKLRPSPWPGKAEADGFPDRQQSCQHEKEHGVHRIACQEEISRFTSCRFAIRVRETWSWEDGNQGCPYRKTTKGKRDC